MKNQIFFTFLISIVYFGCQKDEVELPSGDYKPPILTKPTIVNVYPTAVELNAEFEYIGQEPIGNLAFQIGKKEDFDTSSTDQIRYLDSIPTDTTPFDIQITGLDAATTYLVKSLAKNTNGKIFRSFESLEFTTPDYSLPAVKTIDDENNFIAYGTSARLTGEIVSNGGLAITEYGYTYSDQTNLPTTENRVVMGSTTENSLLFDYSLRPLVPNTTYYVRTFAINDKGTSYGLAYEFNSGAMRELPELSLETVRALDFEKIELKAEVLFEGSSSISEHGFVWSANEPIPTLDNYFVKLGSEVGDFAAVAENLNPETFYSFRAFAVNDSGITYTDVLKTKTLVNKGLPGVRDLEVNLKNGVELNIEANFFRIGDENILKHGFEISKSDDFTNKEETINLGALSDAKIQNGQFTGEPGTEYFVRAFAMNTKDTVYSETVSKTTNQDSRLPSVISFTKSAAGTDFIDLEYELNFGSKHNTFTNASINIYSGNQVNSNSFIQSVSISKNKTENIKRIYGLSTSSEYSFKIVVINPDGQAISEILGINTLQRDFLKLSNLKYVEPIKYNVKINSLDQNLDPTIRIGIASYTRNDKLINRNITVNGLTKISVPAFDRNYKLKGYIEINDTLIYSGKLFFKVPKPIPNVELNFTRLPINKVDELYYNRGNIDDNFSRRLIPNHKISNDTFKLNGLTLEKYFDYDTSQTFNNYLTAPYYPKDNTNRVAAIVGYDKLFIRCKLKNDSLETYIYDTIKLSNVEKINKIGSFNKNARSQYGEGDDYGKFQAYSGSLYYFGNLGISIFDTTKKSLTFQKLPPYIKELQGINRVYLTNNVFYLGKTNYQNNSKSSDSIYLYSMKNGEWGNSKGIAGPKTDYAQLDFDGISKGSSFYMLLKENSDFYLTKFGSNGKWTTLTKMTNFNPSFPTNVNQFLVGELYFEDGTSDHWASTFMAFDFGSQDHDFKHLFLRNYSTQSNIIEFKGDYYFLLNQVYTSNNLADGCILLIRMFKDGTNYDFEVVKALQTDIDYLYITAHGDNIYALDRFKLDIYRIYYEK
ncbi:MAG: fibronectin type III domain-containing protein [Bacteroidia bacterium]